LPDRRDVQPQQAAHQAPAHLGRHHDGVTPLPVRGRDHRHAGSDLFQPDRQLQIDPTATEIINQPGDRRGKRTAAQVLLGCIELTTTQDAQVQPADALFLPLKHDHIVINQKSLTHLIKR